LGSLVIGALSFRVVVRSRGSLVQRGMSLEPGARFR
jgi:hypothetical protein